MIFITDVFVSSTVGIEGMFVCKRCEDDLLGGSVNVLRCYVQRFYCLFWEQASTMAKFHKGWSLYFKDHIAFALDSQQIVLPLLGGVGPVDVPLMSFGGNETTALLTSLGMCEVNSVRN